MTIHHWTPDELSLMAKLIRRRWPASRMAPVFKVTRSAVLGCVSRNEDLKVLMARPRSPKTQAPPPVAKKYKEKKALEEEVKEPAEPVPVAAEPERAGPMRLVPLLELGLYQCRWPQTEDRTATGGFLFCGRACGPQQIYCRQHRKLASRGWEQ